VPELGRVLIVEDQSEVAAVLRDLLVELGYAVKVAVTGMEALTLVPVYRPDAVLLDLGLPGLPGHAVLQELRRRDPALPVVVVTGNKDVDMARSTLAAGAFDYLPKPFAIEVLERVVAAAIVEHERRKPPPQG